MFALKHKKKQYNTSFQRVIQDRGAERAARLAALAAANDAQVIEEKRQIELRRFVIRSQKQENNSATKYTVKLQGEVRV